MPQGVTGLGRRKRRGGGHRAPSAPSATHPMTPFTARHPLREPPLSRQWAVSHFITCHNDKSPGNNQDAHFSFNETVPFCCLSGGAFLTKASELN